jgi:CheY-like chemotaxis protein
MLIDDNKLDNFFHERVIRKTNAAKNIISMSSAQEALDYIRDKNTDTQPDLIFLDINMPGMDGWEFIDQYKKHNLHLQTSIIVVMLTTSENPDDKTRALNDGVLKDFKSKPLTKEMLEELLN